MELRHLRYFVAVAEAENVSRAAGRLHVSQPAVSRQVRDLEEELGVTLLERTAKSVRLTPAGAVFLTEARAVLERAQAAVRTVQTAAREPGGELAVGYAPSITVRLLPAAMRAFQAACPRVRVSLHDLSSEEMLTRLTAGKLSVALTARPGGKIPRGLVFTELARYELRVAMAPGHRWAKLKRITLEQLAGETLVVYRREDYPEYHRQITGLFVDVGRMPRLVGEHDGITSLAADVEAGRGAAVVPECLACMVGPRLKLVPLAEKTPPVIVGAITRRDATDELAERFILAAREKSGDGI
jgi:DNA-binding transcriptional LysR family regulator